LHYEKHGHVLSPCPSTPNFPDTDHLRCP
jgi:hypothetical protein